MLNLSKKRTLAGLLLKESEITQYKNLNDAAKYFDELKPGKTKIWYCKPEHFRDFCMGKDFLTKQLGKQLPSAKTIEDTHVLLGSIQCEKLNDIFGIMQGESWSPNGEARNFLSSLGASHTSMSVGDIVEINGNFVMVDPIGFSKLSENKLFEESQGKRAPYGYCPICNAPGETRERTPIGGHDTCGNGHKYLSDDSLDQPSKNKNNLREDLDKFNPTKNEFNPDGKSVPDESDDILTDEDPVEPDTDRGIGKFVSPEEIRSGDKVEGGPYGRFYVVRNNGDNLWVSTEKEDIESDRGNGLRVSYVTAWKPQGRNTWLELKFDRGAREYEIIGY